MAFTELGNFTASMAIKNAKEPSALPINVLVANVGVLHTHAPALHG